MGSVFGVYSHIRQLCIQLQTDIGGGSTNTNGASSSSSSSLTTPSFGQINILTQKKIAAVDACLAELRLLMVSLASIGGESFFHTDDERLAFGSALLQNALPLLEQALLLNGGDEICSQGKSKSKSKSKIDF